MLFNFISAIRFPSWISENAFKIPFTEFHVKWYGLAYIIGVALAYFYAIRTSKKRALWIGQGGGTPDGIDYVPTSKMLEDFAFYCLLGIMIGGRLGYVILYNLPETLRDPMSIIRVWDGGMSFHGGFMGVCAAVWYISRKSKISLWRWADIVAIGAPIGLFLGRMANFINQELWGRTTDVSWAFIFPKSDPLQLPRHPSQLYEAFLEGIVIFVLLWYLTRYRRILAKPGLCAGLFFAFYGLFRTFVEFFREPDQIWQVHEYLTRGMLYSIPMILIGFLIIRNRSKKPPVEPRFYADEPASKSED